jgi:hypothetical protein
MGPNATVNARKQQESTLNRSLLLHQSIRARKNRVTTQKVGQGFAQVGDQQVPRALMSLSPLVLRYPGA